MRTTGLVAAVKGLVRGRGGHSDAVGPGGSPRTHRPRRALPLGAAIVVLAVAVSASLGLSPNSASGDEAKETLESLAPTAAQTKAFLESGKAGALVEEPETDLHAAQTMPHRDLARGEALELAEAVFEPELEAAGGIYDELEPERFVSDHAAIVSASSLPEEPGQSGEGLPAQRPNLPVLVESTLPLRTENASGEDEAVSLELGHSEGELQPQSPLVEVGLPEQLGEGISLSGPEVGITVAGAPENRVATDADGEFAFYPEVAEDSDLIVVPTPEGVETMTDVRSAEAPTRTTYDLALPPGAELRASREGGAEVVEGDRTTLLIPPPTATDAAGNPVQTELTVSSESITVVIKPDASTAYPALVDPTYITEGWRWTLNHDSLAAWTPSTTQRSALAPFEYEHWYNPPDYPGLDITSGLGDFALPGYQANWEYWVPRYKQDLTHFGEAPTTWVYQMFTEGVLFLPWESTANYPALLVGLVDPNYGWEVSEVHYGGQGEMDNWSNQFTFTNEHEQHGDKGADMNLVTYEEEFPMKVRDTYMADAYISVVDEDAPRFLEAESPEHWMNDTAERIPYEAEDKGLGIRYGHVGWNGTDVSGWGLDTGCNATAIEPCPRIATSEHWQFGYNPASLPTGKDFLRLTIGDIMWGLGVSGHTASAEVMVKVDHAAPEVSLSGPLAEQGPLGTRRPSYALRVNATDGTAAAPQSGVKKVEVRVDGKRAEMAEEKEWEPNCQTQNCPVTGEWTLNSSEYTAGPHEVQVIATDAVGNTTTKTLQVELHPTPPKLEVSGTLTEQAKLGTELPSYNLKINASALTGSPPPAAIPTYSSSFGASGVGNGQFSRPGSMAMSSFGNLIVADTGNNRVETFTPNGEYGIQFGTKGSGNGQLNRPTAVAVDANGNYWVTDSGNRRVEEFASGTGAYLRQFGTAGTGNGQFAGSGPEAIAIDYHGNIWVADTYGGRLEKFNENGVFIRSVATRGTGPEQLLQPDGIAIGPGGNVFVTDWEDDKVAEYGEGGKFIRQFGSQGTEAGQLENPTGIAIDSRGDVWVADQNNGRIEEFNQGGEYLGRFGAKGSSAGQFELSYPTGIVTDTKGDVWVTDAGGNRIEKWVSSGYVAPTGTAYVRNIGSHGSGTGQLGEPTGVTADAKGNIWVTDLANHRIEKFNEKGEYQSEFGSAGSANGQFVEPLLTAVDPAGHLWVLDRGGDRVEEFGESGAFIRAFGSLGTGNGNLSYPSGIAVDAKGHVWVADRRNDRVEEFSETGAFIRTFGTKGSGSGQMIEPMGLTTTPEGNVWVTDPMNDRIEEFGETGSFIRSVGSAGTGIGHFTEPTDVKVDTAADLWVVEDAGKRVQEMTQSGEFLSVFGSPGTAAGQFTSPLTLAFTHAGHILVADYATDGVTEWSRAASHSQISTEITVDGKRVEATERACEAESCSSTNEWTLQSRSLTSGSHEVVVRATDGLGNTVSKTLNIQVGDSTKPNLEVGGELVAAPAGWIEQEEGNYGLHATATDSGYGVTSLVFSLDGESVASKTQTCPAGACSATISTTVDAHGLDAGSHPAEVVATDGAGNVSKKLWTINVDPEGTITTEEAEATIEAMEETSAMAAPEGSELIIAPPDSDEAPRVQEPEGGDIPVIQTNVPVSLSQDPSEGTEFEIADQLVLSPDCSEFGNDPNPGGGEAAELALEETGSASGSTACTPQQEAERRQKLEQEQRIEEEEVMAGHKRVGMEPITIIPATVSASAGEMTPVNGSAALAVNTHNEVDTVFRPMSEGGYTFENIRSAAAPEHYAYELKLSSEQELIQVSPQEVAVKYTEGGPVAFTIRATPAHDAIGTAVPTHLTVTAWNVVTLTVEHRTASPAGGSFVYPVMGGTGWEGGYRTISSEMVEPPPPTEEEEEEEGTVTVEGDFLRSRVSVVGPGVASSNESPGGDLESTNPAHWFAFSECINGDAKKTLEEVEYATILGNCSRLIPMTNTWRGSSVRGWFHFNSNGWVWVDEHPADQLECKKWGNVGIAIAHCYDNPPKAQGAITVGGDFRTAVGSWYPRASQCITVFGHLRSAAPHKEAQESIERTAGEGEACNWPAE
jgi:sugar lactone lactonase YvrE